MAAGHNKSCAASGYKRPLAGPLGQLDIYSWPTGSAKDCKILRKYLRRYENLGPGWGELVDYVHDYDITGFLAAASSSYYHINATARLNVSKQRKGRCMSFRFTLIIIHLI